MSAVICYITAGSMDVARSIGRALVGERLAACVNIIPGMTSIYEWEGSVDEDSEIVVLAKTRAELVEPLTRRVIELHDYDLPCVVAIPLAGGNQPFLDWIEDCTQAPAQSVA